MTDDAADVERLAMLLHDRLHHGSWKGWGGLDDDERTEYRAAATAVLADLTERGRILPDPPEVEWRFRSAVTGLTFPSGDEEWAREAMKNGFIGQRRTVGPWVDIDTEESVS